MQLALKQNQLEGVSALREQMATLPENLRDLPRWFQDLPKVPFAQVMYLNETYPHIRNVDEVQFDQLAQYGLTLRSLILARTAICQHCRQAFKDQAAPIKVDCQSSELVRKVESYTECSPDAAKKLLEWYFAVAEHIPHIFPGYQVKITDDLAEFFKEGKE
jgi:hypothetical protein